MKTVKSFSAASRLLDLAAYFVIPCLTLLFVRGSNWFTTNFSVLGSNNQKKNAFVFWGLFVGVYFYIILTRIIAYLAPQPRWILLLPLSLLLLSTAITIPYLPGQLPIKAFFHVLFAFLAAICLILFMILLTETLFHRKPEEFSPYRLGLWSILFCSAFLLLTAGIISSALEIFFTISAALFCRRLERKLSRMARAAIQTAEKKIEPEHIL